MKTIISLATFTLIFGFILTYNAFAQQDGCKCECVCPDKETRTTMPMSDMMADKSVMQDVVGVVTAMGTNAVNVQSDVDGTLYKLWSDDPAVIQDLKLGYRVKAAFIGNSIQNLKVLGVPVEAEPTMIKIN